MEKSRCPCCQGEMVPVPSSTHQAYFCDVCDEIYFEREIIITCPGCKKVWDKKIELVVFQEYQARRQVGSEALCKDCINLVT
jgi:uncharacterized protein YbaR (Trm112 family)